METSKITEKFGKEYLVDDEIFIMGVHHLLADKIAINFKGCNVVLDSCVGAGMMTIALAKYVEKVIAVDIDKERLDQARHNVELAGIGDKVEFIQGDVTALLRTNPPIFDSAFLDPDWAMPGDKKTSHVSSLAHMNPSGDTLFGLVYKQTHNVCLRLPREIDMMELKALPTHTLAPFELKSDLKFYCALFGDLT